MVELLGFILTFDAIFTWAIASLIYKWGLQKTEPKANLFFRLCCVSLGTFIFALIFSNFAFLTTLNENELLGYFISFVYPFSFIFFGDEITYLILFGGALMLLSVFILSSKDKSEKAEIHRSLKERISEDLIIGVLLAIGTAFFWAIAIISFNQARLITGDVFVTNFFRVVFAMISIAMLGIFQRDYYSGFKKENRKSLKYFVYIGIAGVLSLGFADTLFYKAVEINGLILTSTFTVNTPMVQQIFSILILKEKFRKRFIFAVILIIFGNYIILFL
jgi:drug/metabolite transporter (DMT)-like permease